MASRFFFERRDRKKGMRLCGKKGGGQVLQSYIHSKKRSGQILQSYRQKGTYREEAVLKDQAAGSLSTYELIQDIFE